MIGTNLGSDGDRLLLSFFSGMTPLVRKSVVSEVFRVTGVRPIASGANPDVQVSCS